MQMLWGSKVYAILEPSKFANIEFGWKMKNYKNEKEKSKHTTHFEKLTNITTVKSRKLKYLLTYLFTVWYHLNLWYVIACLLYVTYYWSIIDMQCYVSYYFQVCNIVIWQFYPQCSLFFTVFGILCDCLFIWHWWWILFSILQIERKFMMTWLIKKCLLSFSRFIIGNPKSATSVVGCSQVSCAGQALRELQTFTLPWKDLWCYHWSRSFMTLLSLLSLSAPSPPHLGPYFGEEVAIEQAASNSHFSPYSQR